MTNSAQGMPQRGMPQERTERNDMTIAAGSRRPGWFGGSPGCRWVALLFTSMPVAQAQARSNAPESFADLAEKLLPAVVNISTTQNIPERRRRRSPSGSGNAAVPARIAVRGVLPRLLRPSGPQQTRRRAAPRRSARASSSMPAAWW